MRKRTLIAGALASSIVPASGSPGPAWQEERVEPDPDPVGPGALRIAASGSRGRIVVADSFSYCYGQLGPGDVLVGGSYAGASTTSDLFRGISGIKAVIGHDAGIGKAQAGISGLPFCDRHGIPMAAVAGATASLSNGNSVFEGRIGSVNAIAWRLGVRPGQPAGQAAELLLGADAASLPAEKVVIDEDLHEMVRLATGHVFARVWLLNLPTIHPDDVFALGTHSARVAAEHAFKWNVKGWIANDAGMAKNHSGIAGLGICDERGMPAASVSADSASIGDALSTYYEGIISAVNQTARAKGVAIGMRARDALLRMAS